MTKTKNGSKGKGAAVKGKGNGASKSKAQQKPVTPNKGKGKTPVSNGKATPKTADRAAPGALSKGAHLASKPDEKGLRLDQVRVLRALSKSKRALTKPETAEAAGIDPTKTGVYIGPRKGESPRTSERWAFPGLVELGYVRLTLTRPETDGAKGRTAVEITAAGRKALAAAEKTGKYGK